MRIGTRHELPLNHPPGPKVPGRDSALGSVGIPCFGALLRRGMDRVHLEGGSRDQGLPVRINRTRPTGNRNRDKGRVVNPQTFFLPEAK